MDSGNADEACADAAKDDSGAAAVFATAREKFAIWRLLRRIGDEICQRQKHVRYRYQIAGGPYIGREVKTWPISQVGLGVRTHPTKSWKHQVHAALLLLCELLRMRKTKKELFNEKSTCHYSL